METIDEEITDARLRFIEKQAKADKPFFVWWNSTAHALPDAPRREEPGKSGQGDYSDRMVEHDEQVGQMLDKLDELGIADNTIVMYSTDNGAENDTWPDGGNTPFRGEKDTNWEGGLRVPCVIRWPGEIKPGTVLNDICLAPGHAADACSPPPAIRTSRRSCSKAKGRRQDLQGPSRRLQHAAVPTGAGEGEPAERPSSTSATTASDGTAHRRLEDGA